MTHSEELPPRLTGLAETALGVTFLRDMEHQRTNRLFEDPLARLFLDAAGDLLRAARPAVSPDFTDLWFGGPRAELDWWFHSRAGRR
ncbi:hypothetical protein [Streptomyces zagrosensis]|uniref:O-methyltransferase involved in polyketide biosynthesis n=1 Tax=Streptomyces zagrosensis TaxID=1042984 RepID=A0A7W9UYG8_9ACTN|nr:hypothetical protein [Streptomyces zagrosensis]MBB5935928.1 O-methyltransferase involved in polyketide biosynthesis [Streptomyces zagrosensis]